METINKISNEEIEIVNTRESRMRITKEQLLAQRENIDKLLLEFDK